MILDSLPSMQKLDSKGVYLSITSLSDQMKAAWSTVSEIPFPPEYQILHNVVLAGMGGSALGGRIVQSLFSSQLRVPFEICTEYKLPNHVDSNTLVILSSYSGNTEETLSAAHEALSRRALVFGVATGGKLAKLIKEEELPGYIYEPKYNPSGQPRMGLGYSVAAVAALLSRCGIISIDKQDFGRAIEQTSHFIHHFGARVPLDENPAKLLAVKLADKIPVIISSEFLKGSTHAFKNQLNENAKQFAEIFDMPELNHHLVEGLVYPARAKDVLEFVFFKSNLYHDRVSLRYPVTMEIIEKNHYPYTVYDLTSQTKLEQVFECLVLGSYVSFYIAMLHGKDPTPIPWVDYLKERLKT